MTFSANLRPVSRGDKPRSTGTDRRSFRADIEGMRAIAVLAVMAWHAGFPGVPGGFIGVDIFFVISGYLMAATLLRDVETRGRVRIGHFYIRRIRRLLPAVATTMAGTAVMAVLLLPPVRWRDIVTDMVGSALYVVNWVFADRATDYLAQGQAPSPLLHFWSLSIEEQFYLVLPLLVALVCVTVAATRARRWTIGVVLLAATAAGFAYGAWLSFAEPERAYFVTPARAWELALGGVVAVAAPWLRRRNAHLANLAGWLGLVTVVAAIVLIDASMPFPGFVALAPTVGAAAILAAGLRKDPRGPVAVLRNRPMQRIGALSYSLYLWHWPILVAAAVLYGDHFGQLSFPVAALSLAVSVVPAWLSFHLVEERWRQPVRWRPGLAALRLLAVSTAISLLAAGSVAVALHQFGAGVPAAALNLPTPDARAAGLIPDRSLPSAYGAQVLNTPPRGAATSSSSFVAPSLKEARRDTVSGLPADCVHTFQQTLPQACILGDPEADVVVAVVGDSHARQWLSALGAIGQQRGWKILAFTKSSCPMTATLLYYAKNEQPFTECRTWGQAMNRELHRLQPDVLMVGGLSDYRAVAEDGRQLNRVESAQAIAEGYSQLWHPLIAHGTQLVVLADTWWPGFDIADCVSSFPDQVERCAFERGSAQRPDPLLIAARELGMPVSIVELNEHICPTDPCPAVIGNVLVYRDVNHLTNTYVLSLLPRLRAQLEVAIPSA